MAQRFGHRHRIRVIEFQPAVCGRLGQAQQAQLAQLLEHCVRREDARFLPFVDMRIDFAVDEALQGALQLLVLMALKHGRLLGFMASD